MKKTKLWLLCICLIGLSLIINNILWISGSPEYIFYKEVDLIKDNHIGFIFNQEIYTSKLDYIINYRVLSVLTNWRDVTTALIIGSLLFLIIKHDNQG